MHPTHGAVPPRALVTRARGGQVEGMRRPTTLLPTLRSTSTTVLALGLLLTACGDDGSALETGEESSSTAGAPTTAEPTTSEPTTAESTTAEPDPDTGDTDEPDTTGEPDTGDTDETDTDGPEPALEEQLEGHWISEVCEPLPQADGSVLYFNRDFTLSTQTWSIVGTIFGDDGCTFPLLTLELGGDYAVVGPAAGIDGAHEANFDRSSIALTPHVDDFVAWFDGEGCGSEPWAIGVSQDVTEGGCAFVPSAGACPVEHDLVALDGPDRLFFGLRPVEGDMCTPRTRPAMLGEHPVLRQDG